MYEKTLEAAMITLDSLGAEPEIPSTVLSTAPLKEGKEEAELKLPSSHYSTGTTSSIEERAISLLGNGVPAESVAAAIGVTPSRISQLLSQEAFAEQVAELRYKNLQAHNTRDAAYDTLEDRLLSKLDKSLPLLIKPESILKAMQIVNAAKRRGQNAPDTSGTTQNVVTVILPTVIAEKFTVSLQNQVTKAGDQELLTIPSGNLLKQVEDAQTQRELTNDSQLPIPEAGS